MNITKQDDKWQLVIDNFEQCQNEHKKILEVLSLIYNRIARFEEDESENNNA